MAEQIVQTVESVDFEERHVSYFEDISKKDSEDFKKFSLPFLYTDTLPTLCGIFSQNEIKVIIEHCKTLFCTEGFGLLLSDIIEEESEINTIHEDLGVSIVALCKKINELPVFSRAVLHIWAHLYWKIDGIKERKEYLYELL